MSNFQLFNLEEPIVVALEKMGYTEPTPVQAQSIPLILEGIDLIALAQTGSGKTAACAIPLCSRVNTNSNSVQVLVIVPTRELALQYATEAQKIGSLKGVKAFAIFGGVSSGMQLSKLNHGVQILVSTPGRLIDFIYSREIDLSHVEVLVLDEADEMLSMGFYEDLKFIIQCLVQKHQTLLFSATMPRQIKELAKNHMKDPKEIVLTTSDRTPSQIDHRFLYCRHMERNSSLIQLMKDHQPNHSIIFCHSRHEVEKVCAALQKKVDGVDFFHAGLTQDMRTIITNKFRSGKIKHLVATDVVSRGLDFSGITHVFIYHLGDDPDVYVHRAGRTGRYDKAGMVITLITDRELGTLKQVLSTIKREAIWIGDPPKNLNPSQKPRGKYPPRKLYCSSSKPNIIK